MAKSISRLEMNREVRRILVKHGIDTSKLHFSCHGRSLMLTGGLYKSDGSDLENQLIEIVMQEFGRLGVQLHCELENWTVSAGMIAKKGAKKEEPKDTNKKADGSSSSSPSEATKKQDPRSK